ncbi:hypothetical protein ACWOUW_004441, partial [Vibrio vulnificus]
KKMIFFNDAARFVFECEARAIQIQKAEFLRTFGGIGHFPCQNPPPEAHQYKGGFCYCNLPDF